MPSSRRRGRARPFAFFISLSLLAPLLFLVSRSIHTRISPDSYGMRGLSSRSILNTKTKLVMVNLKSILTKEVIDAISAIKDDSGSWSLDYIGKKYSSSPLRINRSKDAYESYITISKNIQTNAFVEHNVSLVNSVGVTAGGSPAGSRGFNSGTDASELLDSTKFIRRRLRETMRGKRAMDLVQLNEATIVKLENAAFEHSKVVDSAVLGKYNIWRRDNENENADTTVRLMHDQIIMARVYSVIAKSKDKLDLYQDLMNQIKETQNALGDATADADLPRGASKQIKEMGQVLSKAREQLYDCKAVTENLRAMLQSADGQVRSLKKQSTFLSQLAAKTIPNGIHCLSMRLSIAYYLLPPEKRKFPNSKNLENPNLYHYALFSDNVLAASVVVNSTIMNAKEPEKHVFHVVTDKLNFGAMSMWFLLNPPGKATIHVENVDDFKWLNSSYCPVIRQLESASMKAYYFKADHPTTLSAGSSSLKYRNPKYLSMLNHLRFYLPQVYPKLNKILFLDDDIVVQKDLTGLWSIDLKGNVNGAVETCGESFHRFDKYLNFSNPHIARNFDPNACGWAYGMNMFDLNEWKKKDITGIYHKWQTLNEDRALWKLGTLPPGLLTFYKLTHPLDKSWHVLGLGYNPSVDPSEIEHAAVIHYNGNMKPWLELAMTRYSPYWTKYIKYDDLYIQKCKLRGY